jgi:acetoacetate decarboxylase
MSTTRKVRWVKTPEQVAKAAASNPEFLSSKVCSIRVVYETDPAIVRAVTPQPLEPADRPEVCVTFSHVAMQITPEFTFEIGSAIFGTRAVYEGVEGIFLLTMPMTTEAAVVGGRETYGEPKKIAEIDFRNEDGRVSAAVSRFGMTYLGFQGHVTEPLGPRAFTEYGYCYKAFPSCDPDKAFDEDPLLVRLEWRHEHASASRVDGELLIQESPLDPVADLPVRKIVKMEYEEGTSQSNGRVLRRVPAEWVLPFLHGRYDDTSGDGIEIAV